MGRVIHRQTNRQHKEHGGHYIDCQIPEIHCPHDVNLVMCNKCIDSELKVVIQEEIPHALIHAPFPLSTNLPACYHKWRSPNGFATHISLVSELNLALRKGPKHMVHGYDYN